MSTAGRAERQIRRAAHAFPPRWRQHSGDELVATAVASLPPGAERVPRHLLVDIVLAGWRERLRDRPPLGRWLLYVLGFRIPTRWQAWARDDIEGTFYAPRAWLRMALFTVPVYVAAALAVSRWELWLYPLVWLATSTLMTPLFAERWRTKARRRNGIREDDPPWPPVPTFEPRRPEPVAELRQRRTGG